MMTVFSYKQWKQDANGVWHGRVIKEQIIVPETAWTEFDELVLIPGTIINECHTPDCRWWTKA